MNTQTDISISDISGHFLPQETGDMAMAVYNTIHSTTSWKLISRKLYSCNPVLKMNRRCGVARCSRYP